MRTQVAARWQQLYKAGHTLVVSPARLRGSSDSKKRRLDIPSSLLHLRKAAPLANRSVPDSLWGSHGSTGYKEVEFASSRL